MITVMADGPTYVDLIWIEKRVSAGYLRQHRLRADRQSRRSTVAFAPGDVLRFNPLGVE